MIAETQDGNTSTMVSMTAKTSPQSHYIIIAVRPGIVKDFLPRFDIVEGGIIFNSSAYGGAVSHQHSRPIHRCVLYSVFCVSHKGWLTPMYYFLFLLASETASIIKHSGYDSSEAATSHFVLSCFMPKGLKCHTETRVIRL